MRDSHPHPLPTQGQALTPAFARGRLFLHRGGRDFYPHPEGEGTYGECMFLMCMASMIRTDVCVVKGDGDFGSGSV